MSYKKNKKLFPKIKFKSTKLKPYSKKSTAIQLNIKNYDKRNIKTQRLNIKSNN